MKKRILSILLALVFMLSLFPSSVLATGDRNEVERSIAQESISAAPAEEGKDDQEKKDKTYVIDPDAIPVDLDLEHTIFDSVGSTIVAVTGKNLPKDARLVVTPYNGKDPDQYIRAIRDQYQVKLSKEQILDVKILVGERHWEPTGGESVMLYFINDDYDSGTRVWHFSDKGDRGVASELQAMGDKGYVFCTTSGFSYYVVANATPIDRRGAKGGEPTRDGEGEPEQEGQTWTVTFYNRDGEIVEERTVNDNEPIGDLPPVNLIYHENDIAYWYFGTVTQSEQNLIWTAGTVPATADFVVTKDLVIGPKYEPITYTINFYSDENLSTLVATRDVTASTSYCLNDIPAVPIQSGAHGRWVYSEGDFSNNVSVDEAADSTTKILNVWAVYTQNVFTVQYQYSDAVGNTKIHQTDTYYTGQTLKLPAEPGVEGKDFDGWVDENGTEHFEGEAVTSNLILTARFRNQFYVRFVIQDGEEVEQLSQYFRSAGEAIRQMPQNPFVAGKIFEKWVKEGTDEEVTADTIVNESFTVVAVFHTISVYNITVEYYYIGNSGEVIFNTDLLQVETHELPYTITAPSTTKTDPNEVAGAPIYYPETPTVTVTEADFTAHACTVRILYVPYTAEYDFVYKLKDLTGDGYTEIPDSREHIYGVLNSSVTPTVKTFDYAEFESAQSAEITEAVGQELVVYYNRKNYQLSYETNGGSYVGGATVPYGKEQPVTSTVPTRDGYTFAGWYLDEGLTQAAGSAVTITGDTTLYAKWTGDTVDYTIVYMFEKYNDAGTVSSFVYDNSETGSGTVGTTVYANDSSIPDKTKKGWEKDTEKNAASSVVIKADGSAVLNVYYKLRSYVFTFDINNDSSNNRYRMTIGGTTYQDGNNPTRYSFTAKLGEDISSKWPINGGNARIWDNNNGYYFYYWRCQGTSYASKILRVTDELLPSNSTSISVTGHWRNNNNNIQVNYYLQNADDDGYTLSTLYSQTAPSGSYSPKEIAGYTYDHSNNSTSGGWYPTITAYNFYYNRHAYQIEYYYGTDKLKTISNVKYDATITSSTYNWTPTQSECGVDSDYSFAGWYDNAGCEGEPYVFSKMPAGATNGSVALVLYAKWNAPSYTVTYVDGDATTTVYDTKTVEKYKKVSALETAPTKEGHVFDGWYTTADGEVLFDWNTQITEDTTIYAHWSRKTLTYTVRYVDEQENSLAPDKSVSDPNYVVGQKVNEMAIAVAGYRPQENSKELTLTVDDSLNVIVFVYSEKTDTTSYTVKYILDPAEYPLSTLENPIEVAVAKTVSNVPGDTASVIEMAAAVDYVTLYNSQPTLNGIKFYPDAAEKTLVLTASEDTNVFYFYYHSFQNATVTVHYVDMNGASIATTHTEHLKVGKTFNLSRVPIDGWDLNKAVEGTDYDGTAAGIDYKITTNNTTSGLEFTLFYQKKVTITAVSASKQYDGEALTLPDGLSNQVTVNGLKEGHSLASVSFSYSGNDVDNGRLNAGIATVTPGSAVIMNGDEEVSGNYYAYQYISGNLEVTKINVTIRIEPDRWTGNVYNGQVKKTGFTNGSKGIEDYVMISHEGYKTTYLNAVWAAVNSAPVIGSNYQSVTHDDSAAGLGYVAIAQSEAGDYTYNVDVKLSDLPPDPNYSVSLYVRSGRLEIKPKPVTITTGSAEKPYDGIPLTNAEANITGLVEGETAAVTATGFQTDVGSSTNTAVITWAEEGNEYTAKESNYTVTKNLGTLKVTAATLTVTVKDIEKTYNGSEQEGHPFVATVTGTGETITTDDYTVEGLGKGDVLTITYTPAKGTNVNGSPYTGSFATTYTIVNAAGEDVTGNYATKTFTPGQLTITPKAVVVKADDANKVYDNDPSTDPELTATVTGAVEGDTINYTLSREPGQNVGEYEITVTLGENPNYTVSYETGTFTITKAKVTVKPVDASKVYGAADPEFDYTVTGMQNGDTEAALKALINATVNRDEGEDVDTYTMTATGATSLDNYDVEYETGTFTIKPINVTVVLHGNTSSVDYDGEDHTVTGYTVDSISSDLYTESDFQLKEGKAATATRKDQGKTMMGLTGDDFENLNSNFSSVTFTYTDGYQEINKAPLTITADSNKKEYDGTPLKDDGWQDTAPVGLKGTDEIQSVAVNGSITEIGTKDNVPSGAVVIHGNTDVTGNYEIEYINGTLEITASTKELAITSSTKSWKYDGDTHTDEVYTVTYDGTEVEADETGKVFTLPTGDTVTITATAAGVKDYDASYSENNNYTYVLTNADQYASVSAKVGTLSIEKRNVTLTSADDSKVYDGTALTNDTVTVGGDGFVSGEGATYDVTGTQTLVGSSANTFTYTLNEGTLADNYEIKKVEGTLTVTDENVPDENVVKKTTGTESGESETEEAYHIGDTVEWTIWVKNIYDEEKTLTVTEMEGMTIVDEDKLPETLAAGEEITITVQHVVTVEDVTAGSIKNKVNVKLGDLEKNGDDEVETEPIEITITAGSASKKYDGKPLTDDSYELTAGKLAEGDKIESVTVKGSQTLVGESDNIPSDAKIIDSDGKDVTAGYHITYKSGTLTVTDGSDEDPVDDGLVVTKSADKGPYELGQKVTFQITATNIYAEAKTITLEEIEGVTLAKDTFEDVAAGETVTTTATYAITEADILNGAFTNTVTAKIGTLEKTADATVNTKVPNGHITIEKETTSTAAAEDGKYALGEKITYKITVKNDGNLTIKDITVSDELTGDEWTIDALKPGEKKEFTAEHEVTEKDILAGEVVNVATAKGTSPDPDKPDVPVEPGEDPEPTEDKNGHITIEKETTSTAAAEDGKYALGEKIIYKITVENDGNLTIKDITVSDELTGDEWTIDSLKPGESKEFTAEHVVTEEDILAGEVVNVATAKGTSPDPEKPDVPVEPGEDPEPTEEKNGHITIKKETTSTAAAEDGKYALGEKITYKITVENDGNLTVTDITVSDELTGDEWTIDALKPGESKEFTAEHVVTEEDILAGEVVNVATAKGTSPDPDKPDVPVEPGEDPEPTEEKNGHITIKKVTTSKPANGEKYVVGEKITYKITVTNDGNLTVTGIKVEDELTGDKWDIASLAPGKTKTFTAKYVVTEDDAKAGEVVNVATAKGTSPDPDKPDVPVIPGEDPEPVEEPDDKIVRTITYKDSASGTVFQDVVYKAYDGDPTPAFGPKDPVRPGYTFMGWSPKVAKTVDGDATYWAMWQPKYTPIHPPVKPVDPSPALNYDDHVAYIIGYPDGNFYPNKYVTRAETATMIFRLLTEARQKEIYTTVNGFSDVDASKWYNDYVSSMANGGYVEGYPDGTFGGDKMITRAEFVTILVRFFGLTDADCIFADVSTSHWAYRYIATATAYGWLLGYEDGTFRPDQAITRAEAVTVINRMLNRGVDATSNIGDVKNFPDTMDSKKWYYYEIIEAANDHEYTGHRPNEQWYSVGGKTQQAG